MGVAKFVINFRIQIFSKYSTKKLIKRDYNTDKDELDDEKVNLRLINAPNHVFDEFYYNYLHTISTFSGEVFRRIKISQYDFIRDCLNALMSLSSRTFIWEKVPTKFFSSDFFKHFFFNFNFIY